MPAKHSGSMDSSKQVDKMDSIWTRYKQEFSTTNHRMQFLIRICTRDWPCTTVTSSLLAQFLSFDVEDSYSIYTIYRNFGFLLDISFIR